MSEVKIHIEMDNDAFSGDNAGIEVARILRQLAKHIEHVSRDDLEGDEPVPRDINGNRVGSVSFYVEDEEPDDEQEYRDFVNKMSTEDIRITLREACQIQCYDNENRGIWVEALVQSLKDQDTDIESIRDYFGDY